MPVNPPPHQADPGEIISLVHYQHLFTCTHVIPQSLCVPPPDPEASLSLLKRHLLPSMELFQAPLFQALLPLHL